MCIRDSFRRSYSSCFRRSYSSCFRRSYSSCFRRSCSSCFRRSCSSCSGRSYSSCSRRSCSSCFRRSCSSCFRRSCSSCSNVGNGVSGLRPVLVFLFIFRLSLTFFYRQILIHQVQPSLHIPVFIYLRIDSFQF